MCCVTQLAHPIRWPPKDTGSKNYSLWQLRAIRVWQLCTAITAASNTHSHQQPLGYQSKCLIVITGQHNERKRLCLATNTGSPNTSPTIHIQLGIGPAKFFKKGKKIAHYIVKLPHICTKYSSYKAVYFELQSYFYTIQAGPPIQVPHSALQPWPSSSISSPQDMDRGTDAVLSTNNSE